MLTFALLHFRELGAPGNWTAGLRVGWGTLEALWAGGQAVLEALGRLARRVNPAIWIALGALTAGMYATCVGLGTMLYRLALRHTNPGRSHEAR